MSNTPAFITGPYVTEHKLEMTLRDYFAANAMQGYAQYSAANSKFVFSDEQLAKDAYLIADAMMKAREA
jgi:hypothetical protein